jgi:hypothetical protein
LSFSKTKIATGVCLTGLLTLGGTSMAAVGATEESSDAAIAGALAAAPRSGEVIDSVPGGTVASTDGSSVTIPGEDSDQLSFLSSDGVPAGMSLPVAAPVHTQVLEGGSARAIVQIDDASSPDSYAFDLALPEGVEPELQVDGSVDFVPSADVAQTLTAQGIDAEMNFGGLDAPWAVDADGAPLDTHYTLTGTELVQHVSFTDTTSFPVMADPEMEWKGYFATLTYTESETLGMRDQGVIIAGMLATGAAMAAFGPPGAAIGAAMVGIGAGSVGIIAATASNAVGDGRCLSLDVPSMMPSIIDC